MEDISTILFAISGGLTLLYYIVRSFITDSNTQRILTIVYYLFLAIGIPLYVMLSVKKSCSGANMGMVFVYGLMPWVLIFGLFSVLLRFCPGWKAPFSNTLGYVYALIRNVKGVMNNLINPKHSYAKDIYDNPSLLVNEFTPDNFEGAMSKLIKTGTFKTSLPNFAENVSKLRTIVNVKDNVSECIWKLLIAGLISSMTASQMVNIKCEHSAETQNKNLNNHMQNVKQSSEDAKNKKEKVYYIRD